MASPLSLQFTARQVCFQQLLSDSTVDIILRLLETECFTAVSETLLHRIVKYTPQHLTNRMLSALLPPHVKELNLSKCADISLMGLVQVLKRCSHVQHLFLNHCSQLMCEDIFTFMGLMQLPITNLSLEHAGNINDGMVHMVIHRLPHLSILNVSDNCKLTDDMFFVDPEDQLIKEMQCLDNLQNTEFTYNYSLTSVDVSGCRGISKVALLHLSSLCGPKLKHVNLSWTGVESSALLFLAGYNCVGAMELMLQQERRWVSDGKKQSISSDLMTLMELGTSLGELRTSFNELNVSKGETEAKEVKSDAETETVDVDSDKVMIDCDKNGLNKGHENIPGAETAAVTELLEPPDKEAAADNIRATSNVGSVGGSSAGAGDTSVSKQQDILSVSTKIHEVCDTVVETISGTKESLPTCCDIEISARDHSSIKCPVCNIELIKTKLSQINTAAVDEDSEDQSDEAEEHMVANLPKIPKERINRNTIRDIIDATADADKANNNESGGDETVTELSEIRCELVEQSTEISQLNLHESPETLKRLEVVSENTVEEKEVNETQNEQMVTLSEHNTQMIEGHDRLSGEAELISEESELGIENQKRMKPTDHKDEEINEKISTETSSKQINTEADKTEVETTSELCDFDENVPVTPLFQPMLVSLDIVCIKFVSQLEGSFCLERFFEANKTLQKFCISWKGLSGDLMKNLVPSLAELKEVELVECTMLQTEGVMALGQGCPKLAQVNLTGVDFFKDYGISPILSLSCLNSLSLAGSEVSDVSLQRLVEKQGSSLRELDLSWCEENITEKGINTVCQKCTNLKVLNLRKCSVSNVSLRLLSESCTQLTNLSLECVDDFNLNDSFSEHGLMAVAEHLINLQTLDISWNLTITDTAIKTILSRCVQLENAIMNGIKTITVAPFLPIISGYRSSGEAETDTLKIDAEPPETVCTRSCLYAPSLRVLELEYCDLVDENKLMDVVQACKGSLKVTDYYGQKVCAEDDS